MKKENIVLIIIFILAVLAILSMNLIGKKISIQSAAIQIDQLIETAKVETPPGEMITINKLSIEPLALTQIERKPEEPIEVIVCFKEEAVEKTIKKIEETKAMPFEIKAIAPFEHAIPFRPVEKQTKLKAIAMEIKAIEILQKEIVEALPKENFELTHHLEHIPCSIGLINKGGIVQLITKEADVTVTKDIIFKQTVHEAIELIKADKVWKRQAADQRITGKGINVGIIDSGIDYRHDKLGGCIGPECRIVKGWNSITNNENVIDIDGHGTHLAGIVASVAPDANLFAVKTCQGGVCSASEIAEGIDWCLDNGCHVATLSLGDGGSYPPDECRKLQTLRPAFEAAADRDLTIFVSSGNEGKQWPAYPACDAKVISVGSVNDYDDKISDFSNLHPDILAPGVSIKSTWLNNDYSIMAGTSQSAAFAAATAALYIQAYAAVKKRIPTPFIIEEQFETNGKPIPDKINNIEYPRIDSAALISTLIGEEPLPSFICGNFRCEFELGEDAQNCPQDCKALKFPPIPSPQLRNHTLSLDIKDWQEKLTPARVEIRGKIRNKILVKDFMYDYYTTEIELPEAVYDVKLGYGSFSAILRSINLNKSLSLEIKLEDITEKIEKIPEFPHAQIKAVYALGYESENAGSAIICFDRKLSGNSTFVFRCPWDNKCEENWTALMSMTPKETSCLLLIPGAGTAFAVAEIPEAVCGNGICESSESDISCPQDCKFKEAALEIDEKRKRPLWPLILIFVIAAALVAFGFFLKKAKAKKQKLEQKTNQKLEKLKLPSPPKPPRSLK